MRPTIVGSILHGAYGDYYEQAVCLKHFRLTHPEARMKLFAASPHRLAELRVLDFSWADSFEFYPEMSKYKIDHFLQFQGCDRELRAQVVPGMPADMVLKLDAEGNRLPWDYLRSILPLTGEQQLSLSELGRRTLPDVMRENGVSPELFRTPTIGFLWRHRTAGGAVRPVFQSGAEKLVKKYSSLFRQLIELYGCHILICGMNVGRTESNMHRIDAKYPAYGLDLSPASSTHLKGLSWALELEILSRCTLCVVNASGFSEALWVKRRADVLLVDPPLHYLAKAIRHRVPFFNLAQPSSLISAVASHSEEVSFRVIKAALDRLLRQLDDLVPNLQKIAQ